MTPTLSIIIPTINRVFELEELFNSLLKSSNKDFEILVIDQNLDNKLDELISVFKKEFKLRHFKILPKGASNARNFGISKAVGDAFCFPDDDCKFFDNTIDIALLTLEEQKCDVVFGKCVDELGNDSVIKWNLKSEFLTKKVHSNHFVEATMFSKRKIMINYPYDEGLGVGTFHGAEEAYDLVLRLLNDRIKLYYNREIIFYHPNKVLNYSSQSEIKRVFSYRCGFAKLCFKHKFYFKYFKRLMLVILALPFYFIFNNKKVRYYFAELLGLLSGVVIS